MTDYTVEIQPDLIRKMARTEPVRAASELVWNGLDADATEVSIDLEYDDLGGMSKIVITDNGGGIPYEHAPDLFRKLGGSWKRRGARTKGGRQLHGYEGRGRYKAFSLGRVVDWYVTYEKGDGKRYSYVISILEANTKTFSISDEETTTRRSGVRVEVSELDRQFRVFEEEGARQHIAEIFALYLQNYRSVAISLQGERIDTSKLINEIADYEMPPITDDAGDEHEVRLEIIEWKSTTQKALYLCNEESFPLVRVLERRFHTGEFHFSSYLQSSHFADLDESDQLNLAEMYPVVVESIDQAQQQIREHFLERAAEDSKSVVDKWKEENVYPYQGEAASSIEQVERKVFDIVATTANDFIPDFKEAPTKQKAMHLHMLRSALERSPEDLQLIFQEVLDLPARKRQELAELLADISLTGVINAAKTVSDRLKFLDGLEAILYDGEPKERLKERSQLHRILAEEAWVFGEEFHLTADDEGLTKVLQKYARKMKLNVVIDKPVKRIDETTGIIDLMLSRSRPSYKPEDTEFLVVELKRPSVKVGSEETTQIESYAFAVAEDERFRSASTKWNFWVISNEMDRHAQLKAKQKDMPSGVIFRHSEMDLTIWAKTWGQLLDENRSRLRFFQERLEQKVSHEKGLKYLTRKYGSILDGVLEDEPETDSDIDVADAPAAAQ